MQRQRRPPQATTSSQSDSSSLGVEEVVVVVVGGSRNSSSGISHRTNHKAFFKSSTKQQQQQQQQQKNRYVLCFVGVILTVILIQQIWVLQIHPGTTFPSGKAADSSSSSSSSSVALSGIKQPTSSVHKVVLSQSNLPPPLPATTLQLSYDTPPSLQDFPLWVQNYVTWHQQMRAQFPGMLLWEHPKAPKLLVRTCLGLCGGLHDRLGQLPWDVYLANITQRVLLIAWQRPRALEHFLHPHILDWTIPPEAHYGFDDIRTVRSQVPQLFQDFPEDRPDDTFWTVQLDQALNRAIHGQYKEEKVLRHRILGHLGEHILERRLQSHHGQSIQESHALHTAPVFGNLFWLFFRPAPDIDHQFRSILSQLQLRPHHYTAVHCRVRHPKATAYSIHVKGKNPNYPADKTGLPWEGETRQFALDVASKALSCAIHIPSLSSTSSSLSSSSTPIYFLSDSNDLVRHVTVELQDPQFLHVNASQVDATLLQIVSSSTSSTSSSTRGGIYSRDVTLENAHLDRQKGREPSAYYGTFLDLLLAVHAHCVVYGIGFYAVFAAKISGTDCKWLYQQEAWGNQLDKQAHICEIQH